MHVVTNQIYALVYLYSDEKPAGERKVLPFSSEKFRQKNSINFRQKFKLSISCGIVDRRTLPFEFFHKIVVKLSSKQDKVMIFKIDWLQGKNMLCKELCVSPEIQQIRNFDHKR